MNIKTMKYVVNYREVTREEYAQSMAEVRNRNKVVSEYYGENSEPQWIEKACERLRKSYSKNLTSKD